MKYTIGIDLGTSSLKGIVMDEGHNIILSSSASYDVNIPEVGFSEQNPNDWIIAFEEVMDTLLKELPSLKNAQLGMSFSGQMHSLVILDENDEVIRPAILWNDVRTSKESDLINELYGKEIIDITKNRSLEGFTLPKLLWIKEHEKESFDKIKTILLPKDYLRFVITGSKDMDYSDASGTLLLDLNNKKWSSDVINKYGIKKEWLPNLVESSEFVGKLNSKYSRLYGDINVYAGGADNACAALASGMISPQKGMISIGTSGVFLSAEEDLQDYQGLLHFFHHSISNYYSMGVTLSAGSSLSWFKEVLKSNENFEVLLENISKIKPGSDGLIFTPYIMGERTPHFDANTRGTFIGMDAIHTQDHFLRSVLEGITYSLKNSYDLIRNERTTEFNQIISVGGGAKNRDWLQIQADVFNVPISTLKVEEGPALGAAMLAALGEGWFSSVDECIEKCVEIDETIYPNENNVKVYEEYYSIYNQVYESQKNINNILMKKRTTF